MNKKYWSYAIGRNCKTLTGDILCNQIFVSRKIALRELKQFVNEYGETGYLVRVIITPQPGTLLES